MQNEVTVSGKEYPIDKIRNSAAKEVADNETDEKRYCFSVELITAKSHND